jgi:hypothetical protein
MTFAPFVRILGTVVTGSHDRRCVENVALLQIGGTCNTRCTREMDREVKDEMLTMRSEIQGGHMHMDQEGKPSLTSTARPR